MSRSPDPPLTVRCPDCGAALEIDVASGEVLSHRATARAEPADFDSLLARVDEGKRSAERIFEQQLRGLDDRDRVMEEKFRRALERVEEEDDGQPPPRPWDLD
ncbi:MAG: hypothetical protein AAGC60_11535 [Acidobacteriota bacterium]